MPRSHATQQRWRTTIQQSGKKAFVEVPFDPNIVWGERDRYYVAGSIGSCKFRGVLAFDGNGFVLPLGPAWLRDNAPAVGTAIDITLGPEGPLIDDLAPDVATAICADPEAKHFFESVAPFYRKNAIRWIESAKRPATRASRITEVVRKLSGGETM